MLSKNNIELDEAGEKLVNGARRCLILICFILNEKLRIIMKIISGDYRKTEAMESKYPTINVAQCLAQLQLTLVS